MKDVIKIKLAHLPINEFNEVIMELKQPELLVTKEIFKEKTSYTLLVQFLSHLGKMLLLIFPLDYFGLDS